MSLRSAAYHGHLQKANEQGVKLMNVNTGRKQKCHLIYMFLILIGKPDLPIWITSIGSYPGSSHDFVASWYYLFKDVFSQCPRCLQLVSSLQPHRWRCALAKAWNSATSWLCSLMAQAHPEDHHIKVWGPREASYLLPPPTHTTLEDLRTLETQRRGR